MNASKLLTCILLLLVCPILIFSQDTTYYTLSGYKVYYSPIKPIYEVNPIDSGAFKAYYSTSNSIAIEGFKEEGYLKGKITFYHQNGKVKEIANFDRGRKEGNIQRWYANGQKMGDFYAFSFDERNNLGIEQSERIYNLFDSLGNAKVIKGQGDGFVLNNQGQLLESGEVVDGLKDGIWDGKLINHASEISMTYREEYDLGKFVQGESKDKSGNTYQYDQLNEPAEYKGGLNKWGRFLSRNLKYPKKARRMGVEGRVFVQFIVEKDGSPSNFIVVKGIGAGCDEEALRVMRLSKDWEPGKFRGQIARTKLIQNLLFKFY